MDKNYCIYGYFFSNQVVYIGLTNNLQRRHMEHTSNTKDNIYLYAKENNTTVPLYTLLESNLSSVEAQSKELDWIRYYQDQNYILLNKKECGIYVSSLGRANISSNDSTPSIILNGKMKIRYEECLSHAQNCHTLREFRRSYINDYNYALKYGFINTFHWLHKEKPTFSSRIEITDEIFFEEAKKYTTKTQLSVNNKTIYKYGLENNLLNVAYPPKKRNDIPDLYDENYCLSEMDKYSTKTEFAKANSKLYNYCRLKGLLSQFKSKPKETKKVYNQITRYELKDIDTCLYKEVNYNGTILYIDIDNQRVFLKLKTKFNEHKSYSNQFGIICYKINNSYVPYHILIAPEGCNLITYKDGNFNNIQIDNLCFENINLAEFKPITEIHGCYISAKGDIYSSKDMIYLPKFEKNSELYCSMYKVAKLVCKYWKDLDEMKSHDILYSDSDFNNLSIDNLEIKYCNKFKNCLKVTNLENGYELHLKDGNQRLYYLGIIKNKQLINKIKKETLILYSTNHQIETWVQKYIKHFQNWIDEDTKLESLKTHVLGSGCYWSSKHKLWKSKIFYQNKEYSLGYFHSFNIGKLLYEEALLQIKFGVFDKWYKQIEKHRERVKWLFD